MNEKAFVMHRQKRGEMKYLLLTLFPPILVMYLFMCLVDIGILPAGEIAKIIYLYSPLAVMLILGYFLIFKKNHTFEVDNDQIIETNWRRKACKIKASQIYSIKRNFLKEIILLDKDGNRLVCIESNMSNFQHFENWLQQHNLHQKGEI